jgi:hypothetical protein
MIGRERTNPFSRMKDAADRGLRIHVNHLNDVIRHRIETAQQESFRTCETCGQPGRLRESGWIKTSCDEYMTDGGL